MQQYTHVAYALHDLCAYILHSMQLVHMLYSYIYMLRHTTDAFSCKRLKN